MKTLEEVKKCRGIANKLLGMNEGRIVMDKDVNLKKQREFFKGLMGILNHLDLIEEALERL